MTIEVATLKDLKAIQELNHQLFQYEYTLPDHNTYDLEWPFSAKGTNYFTKRIKGQGGFVLIAQNQDKQIAGYIAVGIDTYSFRSINPIAEIENMFVLPKHRRQKIGTKLVQAALAKAKQQGIQRFKVESVLQNENALAFYRTLGFTDFNLILEK